MSYTYSTAQFDWYIASSFTSKMTLKSGGLYLGATLISSSDKRLKFNEKPLIIALDVINKLEPVEYDQTFDLVEAYTPDTPQSHQCGFIAQSVEKIDELKYIVAGGEIGEDGKESLRGINYNAIFTYAVQSNTRVEPNREGSTGANKRTTGTYHNHLLMNSAAIIS
ncbi:MAG: tail fiber domain-containing protein, partial [Candidatus Fonsibacter sp.]